jgi:hypothetical protein
MSGNLVIAVPDGDWFETLRRQPNLAEVISGHRPPRIFARSDHRRCAVTQERTLPALEAAHFRPYGYGGSHEASNDLLFLHDIHTYLMLAT